MLHPKTRGKCKAYYQVILRVEHHLVLKVADVLNWIALSNITVEVGSRELLQKLTLLDVLGKWGVMEAGSQNQVLGELCPYDLLLD